MSETSGRASVGAHNPPKVESDLSPRKTMLVLVIVVGCFAILWPKVFYPMLVGSANQYIKPSPIDKTTGCCDVISENDVNTIKIMSELCGSIINTTTEDRPLSGKEIVLKCRQEVLETCGIDISVVLQEQVRLGQNVKQILNEVRSMNGSLCLKYNFGVAPWRLGVPHRIIVRSSSDAPNIRQERPQHLRSELIHPAFRERGRAIPQPQTAPITRPAPRIVEGRPGPIPGMKPILGGAGHVVPPSKQGTSSMSVIMPIYTIGIVIFFTYTLMKILFRKQPEGSDLYPPIETDPHFRKEVFEADSSRLGARLSRENIASKLVVNAISALLDEVDQEIEARRKGSEVVAQDLVNGTLSNGDAVKPQEEDQPTVKVLGMEMTASCEGGKKWIRPDSPLPPPPPADPVPPPQEIYLEGALPAQSQLLVAESATEPQPSTGEDPAVILSGKMTLSVISVDSETGVEEIIETIEGQIPENVPPVVNFEDVQMPVITFANENTEPVHVEVVEKEVNDLIQEAIQSIQSRVESLDDADTFQSAPNSLLLAEIEESKDEGKSEDMIESALEEIIKAEVEALIELENTLSENPVKTEIKEDNVLIADNGKEETHLDIIEALDTNEKDEQEVNTINEESAIILEETKTEEIDNEKHTNEELVVIDEELESDEELVDEIEEIEYEEESEEELMDGEDEDSEEIPIVTNPTESSSLGRVNGSVEESKYTTASCAAENDISDGEDEELTDEEEIIEVEDEESNDVNHIAGDSSEEEI